MSIVTYFPTKHESDMYVKYRNMRGVSIDDTNLDVHAEHKQRVSK